MRSVVHVKSYSRGSEIVDWFSAHSRAVRFFGASAMSFRAMRDRVGKDLYKNVYKLVANEGRVIPVRIPALLIRRTGEKDRDK